MTRQNLQPLRYARSAALALALPLTTSCTQEVELGDLPRAMSDAYCERAVECGEFKDPEFCADVYGIEQEVEHYWLDADTRQAIANGTALYDAESAYTCVEAVRNTSCLTQGFERAMFSDACRSFLIGTIDNGELCWASAQCESFACEVDYLACDQACCAGTCTQTRSAVLGQPCPAGYCVDNSICGDNSVCVPRGGNGAQCNYEEDCEDGLACLGNLCTVPRALGQLCINSECGTIGLACDTTLNTCVAVQHAGDICNPDVDLCSWGLECDPAANVCRGGSGIGGSCESDYDCGSAALYCDSLDYETPGTCRQLKANGVACTVDWECQAWHCNGAGFCDNEPTCFL